MRYFVSLDSADPAAPPITVGVSERANGELAVTIGEREPQAVPVDVVWLDNVASVRIGSRIVDLVLEGTPPELGVIASGKRAGVKIESERQRAAAAVKRSGGGGAEKVVKAPMPGRVVRVLVKAGAEVEAGTTLCVIEAMKMENEVKAKAACKVLEVSAVEGATVESGAKLFALG